MGGVGGNAERETEACCVCPMVMFMLVLLSIKSLSLCVVNASLALHLGIEQHPTSYRGRYFEQLIHVTVFGIANGSCCGTCSASQWKVKLLSIG